MTPEDRIRQVVGVVRLYHDVHGYGPTMTELAAHMGCSRSVAHKWTQVAEEAGLLQHTPASIRSRQRRTLQVASCLRSPVAFAQPELDTRAGSAGSSSSGPWS